MAFDGLTFQGQTLKVRRPKDYIPPMGFNGDTQSLMASSFPDSPNKLYVGGLPLDITQDQLQEILCNFGELKAINLVMEDDESQGYAFCEYLDDATTDAAIQGLNGMELGGNKLVVYRSSLVTKNMLSQSMPMMSIMPGLMMVPPDLLPTTDQSQAKPSTILQLLNMILPEELYDDQEFDGKSYQPSAC